MNFSGPIEDADDEPELSVFSRLISAEKVGWIVRGLAGRAVVAISDHYVRTLAAKRGVGSVSVEDALVYIEQHARAVEIWNNYCENRDLSTLEGELGQVVHALEHMGSKA
ncbi:hypothetical protein [Actinokineospora sp. HUAS TT18]|uniref:hypothetical protein n=1 Tax=Actinokineospora sp. HUAS TT18 TaxID=3447451 RepID=UPI003F51EE21